MSRIIVIIASCLIAIPMALLAQAHYKADDLVFDDTPLNETLELPDWFKLSFLDLNESLNEALDEDKKGLIIYFGRKDCAYCEAQLEGNWGYKDIKSYTQKHFNVIAIDVRGQKMVTDFDGKTYTESDFSEYMKTNFTPTLLFYRQKGPPTFKLSGYRPPYQFRASLEYVADAHYKKESFREYQSRAEHAFSFGQDELNEHRSFKPASFSLTNTLPFKKPLLIFFEHPRCHACDIMHGGPMSEEGIKSQLDQFDVIQLDSTSTTQIKTPSGQLVSAQKWAQQLKLDFSPTLLFFDQNGKEIIRVSSVIRLYRMKKLLSYIISRSYLTHPTFQSWREINKH